MIFFVFTQNQNILSTKDNDVKTYRLNLQMLSNRLQLICNRLGYGRIYKYLDISIVFLQQSDLQNILIEGRFICMLATKNYRIIFWWRPIIKYQKCCFIVTSFYSTVWLIQFYHHINMFHFTASGIVFSGMLLFRSKEISSRTSITKDKVG